MSAERKLAMSPAMRPKVEVLLDGVRDGLPTRMQSGGLKSVSFSEKTSKRKSATTPDGPFPVVAVGASAGGLEAYTDFFHALPGDTGMASVLIQQLDPKHRSLLAEILSKATKMPVEEVKTGVTILPNRRICHSFQFVHGR